MLAIAFVDPEPGLGAGFYDEKASIKKCGFPFLVALIFLCGAISRRRKK